MNLIDRIFAAGMEANGRIAQALDRIFARIMEIGR
jgi:hypothetical protein